MKIFFRLVFLLFLISVVVSAQKIFTNINDKALAKITEMQILISSIAHDQKLEKIIKDKNTSQLIKLKAKSAIFKHAH